MAIKIRCQECSKKISIDEAFAGGMCRCPYCKALVYVEDAPGGGGLEGSGGARPAAPTNRPAAPGRAVPAQAAPVQAAPARSQARAVAAARAAVDVEHVPMARPVKIQGLITIIIFVLLVFMVAGSIALAVLVLPGRDGNSNKESQSGQIDNMTGTAAGPPPPEKAPDLGPSVLDIKLTAPVIYVVDGGSGMSSAFDSARAMVLKSVESLGSGKFNVIVASEGEDRFTAPDLTGGGKDGAGKLTAALEDALPTGAANIPRALKAAIAKKPKAVVLLTRKAVDDATSLAQEAKAQGTVIHTIAIDADEEVIESMKKLAEAAGGQAKAFSTSGR